MWGYEAVRQELEKCCVLYFRCHMKLHQRWKLRPTFRPIKQSAEVAA